jgi:hypothetical protein
MAATRRYMNCKTFTFTPISGSPLTLTGKTRVAIDFGGNLVTFSGDGDRFPTTIVNDMTAPTMSIDSADIGTLVTNFPPGTRGTAVAVISDAKNPAGGVGSGELTATLSNAVVHNSNANGQHRQFSTGTMDLQAESADGVTSPLAFVIA